MPDNLHITIACSYLHVPGGYEKAMISTANLFAQKGHKVTLLVLDHTADTYYPVHPDIRIVHQPLNFGISQNGNTISRKFDLWNDIKKLKRMLRQLKPDHLLCSEYPFAVAAILGGTRKFTKIYSWEHHHFGAQRMNRFWRFLFRRTYPKLDAIVCLNKEEQQHYLSINKQAVVIPNFIAPPRSQEQLARGNKEFSLLSVTRFNHIKGIDLLMETAKIILASNPGLKWKVIGYGEQQDAFLAFVKRENLSTQLIFQPADKPDLKGEYQNAALFVMTSRNECFPLVLLEAMSFGLPCIAFDCDTGPRHIIRHNETGLLVSNENVQELANAVASLLNNSERLEDMRRNALEVAHSYFPDTVYPLWEKLFRKNK